VRNQLQELERKVVGKLAHMEVGKQVCMVVGKLVGMAVGKDAHTVVHKQVCMVVGMDAHMVVHKQVCMVVGTDAHMVVGKGAHKVVHKQALVGILVDRQVGMLLHSICRCENILSREVPRHLKRPTRLKSLVVFSLQDSLCFWSCFTKI
jgi:hypothetical protein